MNRYTSEDIHDMWDDLNFNMDTEFMIADEVDAYMKRGHIQDFYDCGGSEERDPVERLRFFCSLAMDIKDWISVEQFFDDINEDR